MNHILMYCLCQNISIQFAHHASLEDAVAAGLEYETINGEEEVVLKVIA